MDYGYCRTMKVSVQLVLAVILIYCANISFSLEHESSSTSIVDIKEGTGPGGVWKTKLQWKYYWMKDWELKQMYVPIWKKVWGPIEIREWLPLPKPHPGTKRL